MRIRHAAALALAYWMIVPPQTSRSPLRFDANAPLDEWYIAGIFDSAAECENYKQEMNRGWLLALEPRHLDAATIRDLQQYQAQELCIAADDPSLNEK